MSESDQGKIACELFDEVKRLQAEIFELNKPRPWLRAEEVRESGSYWWRSPGCPYSVVVGVMLSGTDGSFFAHKDQQGWLKAQPLIALGGLWQRIPEPEMPEEES